LGVGLVASGILLHDFVAASGGGSFGGGSGHGRAVAGEEDHSGEGRAALSVAELPA